MWMKSSVSNTAKSHFENSYFVLILFNALSNMKFPIKTTHYCREKDLLYITKSNKVCIALLIG